MAHGAGLLVSRESRCLQFAAHTFDASLAEILTPLIHGACVCIPSEEARLNDIVGAINSMQVDQACFTPSFIGFIEIESVPTLKGLVLAGEAMSQSQEHTSCHSWDLLPRVMELQEPRRLSRRLR